jgi:hypothetical protein
MTSCVLLSRAAELRCGVMLSSCAVNQEVQKGGLRHEPEQLCSACWSACQEREKALAAQTHFVLGRANKFYAPPVPDEPLSQSNSASRACLST